MEEALERSKELFAAKPRVMSFASAGLGSNWMNPGA
jgi:hypothetical protein